MSKLIAGPMCAFSLKILIKLPLYVVLVLTFKECNCGLKFHSFNLCVVGFYRFHSFRV